MTVCTSSARTDHGILMVMVETDWVIWWVGVGWRISGMVLWYDHTGSTGMEGIVCRIVSEYSWSNGTSMYPVDGTCVEFGLEPAKK